MVEPTISRNDDAIPVMDPSMCSQEKNCGQKRNSTAVMAAASATFTTRATVAISDTLLVADDFPSTRVTSTVEAVPMADSAMVTMLRICSAFPTAAAGSVPSGASINWLMLPIIICMNSSTNSRDGKHEHVRRLWFSPPENAGAFATRRLRALRGSARFRRQARRLRGSCSIHGFPSSFRMKRPRWRPVDNSHEACSIRHVNNPPGGCGFLHVFRIHEEEGKKMFT